MSGPVISDAVRELAAESVMREIEAKMFPGAVVLVGSPERVLYHEAFGFAQVVPERVLMRRDSLFDIASVTKVVCAATAVGILCDQGRIDPDAPITAYLPGHQARNADQITLRHLAAHVSGFPDAPRVSHGGKFKGDKIFERLLQDQPSWPVGTRYQYACRNSILLSTMVERVTGRDFGEFCQAEIFTPLEMTESVFNRVQPGERVVATHHPVLGENHNADGRDAGRALGNAGLFTTARDLANFCEMMLHFGDFRGRRVLSEAVVKDFSRTVPEPRFPIRAFLWEVDKDSLHRPRRLSEQAFGHSGNTGISIWIDPGLQVYGIIMTNRHHPCEEGKPPGVKVPTNSPLHKEQYRARGRIADAVLAALGY